MSNKDKGGDNTNEQYLYENYADLLPEGREGVDPDLLRLVGVLDALAEHYAPPPSTVKVIHGVLQQHSSLSLTESKRNRKLKLFGLPPKILMSMPSGAFSRIALLFVVAIVLMGAAYSALSVIYQAFHFDPGIALRAEQKLGKEINQSQTVNGFTVSVKSVYADKNEVILGYTIEGPSGRNFNSLLAWGDLDDSSGQQGPRLPALTDLAGNSLDYLGRGSDNDIFNAYGTGVQDGEVGQVLKYKTPSLLNGAKELKLRFLVGKITALVQSSEDKLDAVTINGPFTFEFTVPIEGSQQP